MIPLSRRTLLKGLGAAAVLLPGLPSAAEAGVTFPQRFVVFFTHQGTIHEAFWPGEGMALPAITAPLAPFASRLLFVDGVDLVSSFRRSQIEHHEGVAQILTGRELFYADGDSCQPGGVSLDQHLAAAIGRETRFPSLELSIRSGTGCTAISSGPNQAMPPEPNPAAAFDRIFGAIEQDPLGVERARAQRKSVLDLVRRRFGRATPRLGSEDRARLDAHLEGLRELERRLDAVPAPGCARPTRPTVDRHDPARFAELGFAQVDNLVAALACDLTRVASIQYGDVPPELVGLPSSFDMHQDVAHQIDLDPVARERMVRAQVRMGEQLAYLLAKLEAIPEGDGTLLDHTLVLWCNELATGSHEQRRMPFVLAGSAGGYFRSGRHVRVPSGTPHNDLLLTIAQAFGLPDTSFGDPAFCTGPLEALR